MDGVQASWAFEHCNPTSYTGRVPGALMLFGFHCWVAKEIVCGQWSHNNPWQVVTAIWNLKSQRRTSSLLSIVTAGASSHSWLWSLLFFSDRKLLLSGFGWVSLACSFCVHVINSTRKTLFVFILSEMSASPRPWLLGLSGIFPHKRPPVCHSWFGSEPTCHPSFFISYLQCLEHFGKVK